MFMLDITGLSRMVWYESMFPIEAMCKLPYQQGHRTAPEDNKLYFVTLLILDSNRNIYVSQKAQNASQRRVRL